MRAFPKHFRINAYFEVVFFFKFYFKTRNFLAPVIIPTSI